jgi:hypothetical protein
MLSFVTAHMSYPTLDAITLELYQITGKHLFYFRMVQIICPLSKIS